MGFDIPNLLDESSPEGRVVREIVDREGVSPEEAVRQALRAGAHEPNDIIGLFSDPESLAIFEDAMGFVQESRDREIQQIRENAL